MPLSDIAKKALDDSARINAENQARKKQKSDKDEADRKQAEDEYNQYLQQQAEIKSQLEDLELKEAQEQAKRKAEADAILAKEKAWEDLRLSQSTEIKELTDARAEAMSNVPYYYTQTYWTGAINSTRQVKYDRSQREFMVNAVARNHNYLIEKTKRDHSIASQQLAFKQEFGNVGALGGSWFRSWQADPHGRSLSSMYHSELQRRDAQAQHASSVSIARAKANATIERVKHENIIQSYNQKREENDASFIALYANTFTTTPTKAGDLKPKTEKPSRELFQPVFEHPEDNLEAIKSYKTQQSEKLNLLNETITQRKQRSEDIARAKIDAEAKAQIRKTKINNQSNAFLTKPPTQAKDIINNDKSIYTFKEAQRQQKELSDKLRNAKSAEEATRIKEEYQRINPYVGTPQTARTKQGTAQQGVLIDLKLNIDKEDPLETEIKNIDEKEFLTFEEPQQGETVTSYSVIKGDKTITVKNEETANRLLERLNRPADTAIPQYNFIDEQGNKYNPTVQELFRYNNYLLNQVPPLPSVQDKEFNKLIQDDPNAFSFDPSLESGETKQVNLENVYAVANKDPVNRGILNTVVNPSETVLGKGIEDVIAVGSSTVNNQPLPTESQTIKFIDTKLKTSEGQKELIGEGVGEYLLARVFGGAPSLLVKAYESKLISPKTLKIAEEIAEEIRYGGRDPATEKLIAKFPDMPESMKKKLRLESNKETVGIEMLDSRTALIKRGTELNEVQTPYIIVKNTGKKAHGTLYETYTADRPGAYSKILISGEQGKELKGGIKQNKDIVEYPATRDNILKAQDVDKLATVGTSEKVGLGGLKEKPLAVIEKIETQEIKTGSIIMETERLNKIKSLNQDVKGLNRVDDFKPNTTTKTTKPATGTGDKININLPKSSNNISVTKSPTTQRRETLENIIRNTNKEKIDVKPINKLSGVSIVTSTQATRSIQATGATQRTEATQTQQTQTQQTEKTQLDTGLKEASQLRTDTISELKTELETTLGKKPSIDPKYSLITKPGLKDNTTQIPLLGSDVTTRQDQEFTLVLKQEQTPIIPTPTKTTIKTTTTRPGLSISLNLKEETDPRKKSKTGKPSISYFRYNVNTESVGRYIEQAPDISTGKSRKVIEKIDRLEKKINTPQYRKRMTKKEEKQYLKEMEIQKKKKGSFSSRMYIPNVSQPKGKKAKKALKKLGFKLDIF